jgi:hypothetical protein
MGFCILSRTSKEAEIGIAGFADYHFSQQSIC